MKLCPSLRAACLVPLLLSASIPLPAQDAASPSDCRPDEIDMGDYCASREPEAQQLKPGARRTTPYRTRSMMPGHAGEMPVQPSPEAPSVTPSAIKGRGFGVQLGAFSTAGKAREVARDAAAQVEGPYHLAPMERGERILWACIHGPFPDKASAAAAQRRLRDETSYKEAFVKPLDAIKLVDLDDANTQE